MKRYILLVERKNGQSVLHKNEILDLLRQGDFATFELKEISKAKSVLIPVRERKSK